MSEEKQEFEYGSTINDLLVSFKIPQDVISNIIVAYIYPNKNEKFNDDEYRWHDSLKPSNAKIWRARKKIRREDFLNKNQFEKPIFQAMMIRRDKGRIHDAQMEYIYGPFEAIDLKTDHGILYMKFSKEILQAPTRLISNGHTIQDMDVNIHKGIIRIFVDNKSYIETLANVRERIKRYYDDYFTNIDWKFDGEKVTFAFEDKTVELTLETIKGAKVEPGYVKVNPIAGTFRIWFEGQLMDFHVPYQQKNFKLSLLES